jgi:signal transduction histidine kinase
MARGSRSDRLLSTRLALASLGTAAAVGVVCAVGLYSLEHASAVGSAAVAQQLALVDDTAAMSAFQYQKGFVAEYLLTGNPAWLSELETSRPAFERWLAGAQEKVGGAPAGELLEEMRREYAAYDQARRRAIGLYQAGKLDDAKAALETNHARVQRLWDLFHSFGTLARAEAERTLADEQRSVRRLGHILVATSISGALASLLVGFMWARRITKPIYELAVQVESAAERTRIKLAPGRAGLDALGEQVGALVAKLEETDAALVEHRVRLIQSEKLSAIGALAAKLAHEVLNPLAGMKAAVQLLGRQGATGVAGTDVVETAEALNREITRVEGLVRRLVNFARPLAPRVEVTTVDALIDDALAAADPTLRERGVAVERHDGADLPPIEVDPVLLTQVLVNLLTNAAQAMAPGGGGRIELASRRAVALGREEITIAVADRGPGIAESFLPHLFKPFFTTKPDGHGLGLAVSQNIVLEHGGRIVGGNRTPDEGGGALFEVQLPVIR